MSYKNFNPYANLKFNYMAASSIQNTYQSLNGTFNKVAMINDRLKYITDLFTKSIVFPSVDVTSHLQPLFDEYKKLNLLQSSAIEVLQRQQQIIDKMTSSFQTITKIIVPINLVSEIQQISKSFSNLTSSIEWPEDYDSINEINEEITTVINDDPKVITIDRALSIIGIILSVLTFIYTIIADYKSDAETSEFRNEVLNILNNQTQILQQHNNLTLQQNEAILQQDEIIKQNSILIEQMADTLTENINNFMDNLNSLNLPVDNENIEH